MKKRKIHRAREVFKMKNQLLSKIPKAKDVEVDLKKDSNAGFKTTVKVYLPAKKCLVAYKNNPSLKVCLEKAKEDILNQASRIRRFPKRRNQFIDLIKKAA